MKNTLLLIFILCRLGLYGQDNSTKISQEEIEKLKKQSTDLVMFFQNSINMLGNNETARSEKDVIINESFAKIFVSDQVQIEDDLLVEREVVTNKSVQDYLKDIVFFYKSVEFTYAVNEVSFFENAGGELVFKISADRFISGINIENTEVKNSMQRFIEINYNYIDKELKIASIYTTKPNQDQELLSWWNLLTPEWKNFFGVKNKVSANPTVSQIKEIMKTEDVDISNNKLIFDLSPLEKFSRLKKLNISSTNVRSLLPVRNSTSLEILSCENTYVSDVYILKYAYLLRELYISSSMVEDLSFLKNLKSIQIINANYTKITDLTPLSECPGITKLIFSNTKISNINGIKNCSKLNYIDLSNSYVTDISVLGGMGDLQTVILNKTKVSNISALASCKSLQNLYLNNSAVSELMPIAGLKSLNRIYCDMSNVSDQEVEKFYLKNSTCLLIYKSDNLISWWAGLPYAWRKVFDKIIATEPGLPENEKLHKIASLKQLNISNNKEIVSLSAVSMLTNLVSLDCNGTRITDINPLENLQELEYLNCSGTEIQDLNSLNKKSNLHTLICSDTKINSLSAIRNLINLEELYFENTSVNDLSPIFLLYNIKKIYADNSQVTDSVAYEFMIQNPTSLLIYRTRELTAWWNNLSAVWKAIFAENTVISAIPTATELEILAKLEKLKPIIGQSLGSLLPVSKLRFLKEIKISNSDITEIYSISGLRNLTVLHFSNCPVSDIKAVSNFTNLIDLNFSGTAVEDLSAISGLGKLEKLNLANTPVKNIGEIEQLTNLIELDISGTGVRSLKPVFNFKELKVVKCYNTKLSQRKVDDFKETNPNCSVTFY